MVMTRAEALTSNYPPAGLQLAPGHYSLTHTHMPMKVQTQTRSDGFPNAAPKLSQTVYTHYNNKSNTNNITWSLKLLILRIPGAHTLSQL